MNEHEHNTVPPFPSVDALSQGHIPEGLAGGFFVYEASDDEAVLFADANVLALFGCASMLEFRALTGGTFAGMVHPEDLAKVQNDIHAQTLTSNRRHDYVRYRIQTLQGETRYVEDFGHLLYGKDGRGYFYVYLVDVDKNEYFNRGRNSMAESQVLASMRDQDRLTGLMKMRPFYEAVQQEMEDSGRDGSLTFAHFDIVGFKLFNDEYGFQRGDDLLCRLARTLHTEFPQGWVARFANDHFMVCAHMGADEMVEHVTGVHNAMLGILDGIRVEIKAGIYELEPTCREVGLACDRARLACNTVKRRYDRLFGIYDADLYERLRLQQHILDTVDEAVEKDYIKVYYQPIVRVSTGKICGYEALARWDDPQVGFLPPARFIATLEESRMVYKVDCYVLRRVCEDLAMLMEANEPVVPVSVNLSRLDFELCDVFALAEHECTLYDIPRSLIDIEITESALGEDDGLLLKAVERFHDAGYHIWIDDFGSGYSALNSLLDYQFDVLKLDLEFLRTFDRHPNAADLIGLIVGGARGMGELPLQEGVERPEHLNLLRRVGCEMAQGYYFSKPLPLEESRAYTRSQGLEWE